jgi:hypothetical protein
VLPHLLDEELIVSPHNELYVYIERLQCGLLEEVFYTLYVHLHVCHHIG